MSRRISVRDLGPHAIAQAREQYARATQACEVPPDEYRRRAQAHRPADPYAIAAEVRRLAASGLTAADVASALRLPLGEVLEALGGRG